MVPCRTILSHLMRIVLFANIYRTNFPSSKESFLKETNSQLSTSTKRAFCVSFPYFTSLKYINRREKCSQTFLVCQSRFSIVLFALLAQRRIFLLTLKLNLRQKELKKFPSSSPPQPSLCFARRLTQVKRRLIKQKWKCVGFHPCRIFLASFRPFLCENFHSKEFNLNVSTREGFFFSPRQNSAKHKKVLAM